MGIVSRRGRLRAASLLVAALSMGTACGSGAKAVGEAGAAADSAGGLAEAGPGTTEAGPGTTDAGPGNTSEAGGVPGDTPGAHEGGIEAGPHADAAPGADGGGAVDGGATGNGIEAGASTDAHGDLRPDGGGALAGIASCVKACETLVGTGCNTRAADFCKDAQPSCQARYDAHLRCLAELEAADACGASQPAANFTCPLGNFPDEVRPYRTSQDVCVVEAEALSRCLQAMP